MKDFITKLWAWITSAISFVITLSAFVSLWKDRGVVRSLTIALFVIGIIVCWFGAVYIWLRKIERREGIRDVKVPAYKKWQRALALAIAVTLPTASLIALGYSKYKTKNKLVVLVAEFKNLGTENAAISQKAVDAISHLRDDDLVPIYVDTVSTTDSGKDARDKLEEYGAAVVVFGWYQKVNGTLTVALNIEFDDTKLKCFDINRKDAEQSSADARFANRDFATEMSKEIAYLVFYALGYWHDQRQQYDAAARAYQQALLQSTSPQRMVRFNNIYYYLGRVSYSQHRFDDAKKFYEDYESENPNQLSLHNALGLVYYSRGELAHSIEEFTLAISPPTIPNPTQRAEYYYNRGEAHLKAGKTQEAKDDFQRAANLLVDDPDGCRGEGEYKMKASNRLKELAGS